MWPFKNKAQTVQGELLKFKVSGMHCGSCAMNIDNGLEELDGVISSKTSVAKSETEVVFKPGKVNPSAAKKAIEKLGYKVI